MLKTGMLNTVVDAIMKQNGVTQDTKGLINEPKGGFFLRGADNQGQCYKIQNTIRITKDDVPSSTEYTMSAPEDIKYFDDPVLTFDDSIVYGCHLDLNFQELKNFCQNQEFQYLMLFQNLYSLEYIGKYGKSNPLYPLDWVKVEQLEGAAMNSDFVEQQCNLPNAAIIRVFYQYIGEEKDKQPVVIKADLEWKVTK